MRSCDKNSFKHNKQTNSSEVRTKTVSFVHQSLILLAWINDGRPSFLLWLRLRLLVVFGEGIWGCSGCNSAMDLFWVVKFPRLHDAQLWKVFSFKYRSIVLCMILRDSSPLVSCFFLWHWHRTLYSRPCHVLAVPFVSRYIFQDGGTGTSTSFGGCSFVHCFVEQV